ncbi:MAG TPA: hypothetical protein VFM93_14160 [Candidatus Limnocylindria bacterium]|nr:hypothetical protein [Candidatus Limnocylindria bacterium]
MRLLLVAMVLVSGLGTPGLGLETREASDALGALFGGAFLLALAALIASWRWPRPGVYLAIAAGAAFAALSLLDAAGLLQPQPPPPAIVAVSVAVAILGAAVIWSAWRVAGARA